MNNSVINFIKSSLKEINPWHNIRTLHTNIWGDIVAGITVAIIALPLALAFGNMSGLGALAGVWGAIAGGIVGGLFGGCMVGVSGPTSPKAAQIGAIYGGFVLAGTKDPDAAVAAFSIIFLSGVILVIISLLKISQFIHYIPYSVLAGFMCGIGVLVINDQIGLFMGVGEDKSVLHALQNFNINALYVSIPSLLILFLWSYVKNFNQIFSKIPAPLLALSVGSFIAYVMNLDIAYIVVDTEGVFKYQPLDFTRLKEFIGPAFALAGLAIIDSLLSCVVADNMTGKRHSSDRETFGQGMANIAAGLVGGVTTATATMRTVANIKFGAKTPLASIVHGLTLLAILLGLGFLVEAIPVACLAAILIKVGIEIMDYRILPVLRKLPFIDLLVFFIVVFITVNVSLMKAVLIGVVIIFLNPIKRLYQLFSQNTLISLTTCYHLIFLFLIQKNKSYPKFQYLF